LRKDGLAALSTPGVLAGIAILFVTVGAGIWLAVQLSANPA
jgi:hypothetical protein